MRTQISSYLVFCCRLSGTGTGAWRGLAYAGKPTRAWSRDLDVTSDEGLVGSEWMAQLYPLPSWRIWSCGEAYSAAVRDISKAELLYGQRVSGRNGGCTSLLGGCLFSHRWGRDGHLKHLGVLRTQAVSRSVPRLERTTWPHQLCLAPPSTAWVQQVRTPAGQGFLCVLTSECFTLTARWSHGPLLRAKTILA